LGLRLNLMQALRSASVLDFRGLIPIRIMDMAIRILTTGMSTHTGTVPDFTGTMAIAPFTRIHGEERVTATGVKPTDLEAGGPKVRRLYFLGEIEAAGPDVGAVAGDGSANSFFQRS
jgi:hypothetical protein